MLTINTLTDIRAADAHVRRITLNILRHADCCPEDVRMIADRLAGDLAWDWHALDKLEVETIFAKVDSALTDKALDEFEADTSGIIDHYWKANPERRDGDGDTYCRLCGHKHIRWEFPLRNVSGGEDGKDTWTGSSCIEQYGLRVDGEATADAALQKLRSAIGRAKRVADADGWVKEHPDHEEIVAEVAEASAILQKLGRWWQIPSHVRQELPRHFGRNGSDNAARKDSKATIAYHRKHGMLTSMRTNALWGSDGPGPLLKSCRRIVAVWRRAHGVETADDAPIPRNPVRDSWDTFIADHPHMNDYQRRRVTFFRDRCYAVEDLYSRNKDLIAEIKAQHTAPPPPPPPRPGSASSVPATETPGIDHLAFC